MNSFTSQPPRIPTRHRTRQSHDHVEADRGEASERHFSDQFSVGLRLLLTRHGCSDHNLADIVLSVAARRAMDCGADSIEDKARIVHEELIRLAPETLQTKTRTPHPPERVESMRQALKQLPDRDLAALRAYYLDGLDGAAACERAGIKADAFAAIRSSLRARLDN